jgi:hypothetical protein
MSAPIFIVGANRSGTTLLRLILNAHSRIAIPDELIYFDSYLAGVPIEQWRHPDLDAEAYAAFVDHFLTETCIPLDGLDFTALRARILSDGPHDFRRPYQCALEAWAQHHGKTRWGEKTPGNLFFADIIHDMFPDAQFIYMVRDPRAGVASMQNVSFFPQDVVFNALSRRKHATDGRALLLRHVPDEQRMTLRYEDLVRDPEHTVRTVCNYLDEPFEPGMLHFHREADRYMNDEAASAYNASATRPISDEHIDRWRDRLDADEIALVETVCREEIRAFDYPVTDEALPWSRRLELAIKKAYWAWQTWRHRDNRLYMVKSPMFARSRSRLRRVWNRLRPL